MRSRETGTARRALAALAICTLAACALAAPAAGDGGSLRHGRGQLPGPAILYKRAARAPQLTNSGVWRAPPILISGASAYRDGEFLYQDFLYDDHGAKAQPDPTDLARRASGTFQANGTYTYPTGRGYNGNAADLVELRVRPLRGATAFRLTLNTMLDPGLVAATIAIGSSSRPRPFPDGAGASAPAALFLTVHGHSAELVRAVGGARVRGGRPRVRVDLRRRQIEVRVPHSAWDPHARRVRLAAGVGLWDRARDRYLLPGAEATATRPGGAGGLARPTAFFNVAFRAHEPLQKLDASAVTEPAWWREREQGNALRRGDLTPFHATVDFGKLARGVDDERAVPRRGVLNRILASHFEPFQGVDYSSACGHAFGGPCKGELGGRLQPYTLYVPPHSPGGDGRYQLTLLLHSLTGNYNQYSGSRNIVQFGNRARPSLVITPEGRGPDGFYSDLAGADTFEVWADVARHYRLDPARTTIAGYSMGGFGTFALGTQYPDLFARAQPTVGAAQPTQQLASLRWVPVLMWNSAGDQLVVPALFRPVARKLQDLGLRLTFDVFASTAAQPVGHGTLAINDQFAPAARFLGGARVVRDPPRVSFTRDAAVDFPAVGMVADHAYWVSHVRLRDRDANGGLGSVDVRSGGFGAGDPTPSGVVRSHGVLDGGTVADLPFTRERQTWGRAPRRPRRDRLTIDATNVASIAIDARRARVTCAARRTVHSDGPLRVRMIDCPRRAGPRHGSRRPPRRRHARRQRQPGFTG